MRTGKRTWIALAVVACVCVVSAAAGLAQQHKVAGGAADGLAVKPANELTAFRTRLKQVRLGKPVTHRGLTMFPLLGASGKAGYETLDEAMAGKTLLVEDTSVVQDVRLVNKGTKPVLILDGEQIVGAKQNRIFNSSLMVPPGKELVAKVSCVEQGRWSSGVSMQFDAAGTQLFARARQGNMAKVSESVASAGLPLSDQSTIWAEVAQRNRAVGGSAARSSAMQEAYKTKEPEVAIYTEKMKWQQGQVGALFASGSEIVGFDLFDSADTMRKLMPKLIRSYALDDVSDGGRGGSATESDARTFLAAVAAAEGKAHPSQGLGSDLRIAGWQISGSVLVVDRTPVHAAVFARTSTPDDKREESPMAPPRQRLNPFLEQGPRPR